MEKIFYPAIFHSADEGGFWISFPDFPECLTQGESMDDAYNMASEALGLCIDERMKDGEELPEATRPQDIIVEIGDVPCLIEFNVQSYRRKHSTKTVKKTLTIPEWLNEAATAKNINFSQVLKEALIQKVGML